MTDQIDITISSTFRDTGVKAAEAAFAKLTAAQDKAAAAAKRAMANPGDAKLAAAANRAALAAQKAEAAYIRTAAASARLANASGDAAGGINILSTALGRVDRTSVAAVSAQTQLARAMSQTASKGEALPRTFAGITDEVKGMIAGSLGVGAALSAAVSAVQSFADAFNFKAELDATTASINVQLQGVRDSGRVWAEATAYASEYKLTQQETTNTVQASIGILRQSQASVEDTFGVLQRLTVLAPGKSIEDAAFSVRELASGDITSIAEQFNISRAKAYEMRDAIQSGADVVTVLSGFLDSAGVSMDTLKIRTEGAAGAMKDLAIAQEDLKLAQAEFAQGPGLALLGVQIEATRGATRLLAGDFGALGDSLAQAFAAGDPAALALAQSLGISTAAVQEAARNHLEQKAAIDASATASQYAATAYTSAAAAAQSQAESSRLAAESSAQFANGLNGAAVAAIAQADGTDAAARANQNAASTAQAAADAIGVMLTKTLEDKAAKEEAEAQTRALAEAQAQIAALGTSVASGLTTAAEGAAILAAQYGITTAQALALIDAQARIAGGAARIANQKANTRDLVPGGPGVNAPGRRGQSDEDILATVKRTTDEITAVGVRAQPVRTAAVRAGGGARASAEQSAADKIKQIAEDTAAKLVAIDERAAEARARAQASLAASINTTSADLVASQEANDLELVGASEDRLAALSAREQAEAQARIASIEAVREARAIADAGDAEQAQAVLDERQKQIAAQQSLDEEYAKRRAEIAGDPAATEALKTQYDEATAALAEATQVRIDLAAQEAAQRAEALAAEKQAVLDSASAQAAALGTTGSAADAARAQVNALIDAINAIPPAKTVTITVEEKGGSGGTASSSSGGAGGSSAKAAGGGTFVTSGPTNFTVGDNPGGVEVVSVTPISGVGSSSISGSNVRMAGGGSAVVGDASDDAIRRLEEANKRAVIPTAARAAGGGGGTKRAAEQAAKEEKAAKPAIADYAKAARENLDLLAETLKIRQAVQDPATWMPLNDAVLRSAAADADKVARAFSDIATTYDTKVLESAKLYSDALGGSFSVIKDGLEVFDLLRGSEALDMTSLMRFQRDASAAIDMVSALGAQAATIPEASVSALGGIASTLAVLPSLGMLGGGGGGGSTTNMGGINVNIYPAAGMDARQIAQQVTQAIGQDWGSRR